VVVDVDVDVVVVVVVSVGVGVLCIPNKLTVGQHCNFVRGSYTIGEFRICSMEYSSEN
jgi:hypothetical protein